MLRVITLGVVFFFSQSFYAQDKLKDQNLWNNFTTDMDYVLGGIGYAYSRPLHWGKPDFINLGIITSSTLGIYAVDEQVSRKFIENKERVPDILLKYGWYVGTPQINYGLTGGIYLTGLLTRNNKLRRTGVLLMSSATATGFLQQLTKSATGRARPNTGFGKNHFRPFGGSAAYRSFPSGHAVLTFTSAHVIAKQFKSWWIKGPIYSLGIIPGLTRIYEGAHWMSDVFLSWSISYFVVEAIDRYLNSRYDETADDFKMKNKTNISLAFSGNTLGVNVVF